MKKAYIKNFRKIAALMMSVALLLSLMPLLATETVFADTDSDNSEIDSEIEERMATAESTYEINANGVFSFTTQPKNATVSVRDAYTVTCVANQNVTEHISVQQYVQNRATSTWSWKEKVGSDVDYSAGSTIKIPLLRSTDDYGNRTAAGSQQVYRIAITYGGTQYYSDVFTITWEAPKKYAYRIAGDNRYDTAIKIANAQKSSSEKFSTVVLASGANYPDALAGSFLAISKDAPILLISDNSEVENKVISYINANLKTGGKVYLLGGAGSISSSIQSNLRQYGYSVTRLGGNSRYETNLKILNSVSMSGKPVIISSGTGYADSLSASSTGYPIMIINPSEGITDEQLAFLKSKGSNEFYITGGTSAVPSSVDSELKTLGNVSVTRLDGSTRYETSYLVAEKFSSAGNLDNVVFAYGDMYPDGLCAGPLANKLGASLILTKDSETSYAKAYVDNHIIITGYVTGGTSLISDYSVKEIMTATSVPKLN